MIRYALACGAGHCFDSWFANSNAFDALAADGLVSCPSCGSTAVTKGIMTPAVVAKRAAPVVAGAEPGRPTAPPHAPSPGAIDVASFSAERREMRALVTAFREKVLASTQDVGRQFPEEARRMHEGDIPHREIRGQATAEEARSLLEDGIMIMPVPGVPEDWN